MKSTDTQIRTIGIAVATDNIEPTTVSRFRQHAENALSPGDFLAMSIAKTNGPYNKSREINRCIRSLLEKRCDIIVQCDIDILTTLELFEETRMQVVPGVHFWVPCISRGRIRRSSKGSWNALTHDDWIKTGGLDERCFGWGFEDDDFHRRCKKIGFESKSCENYPHHVDHAERMSWGCEDKMVTLQKNKEATKIPNEINYLTIPIVESAEGVIFVHSASTNDRENIYRS